VGTGAILGPELPVRFRVIYEIGCTELVKICTAAGVDGVVRLRDEQDQGWGDVREEMEVLFTLVRSFPKSCCPVSGR
jgi:hypothetical protein